MKKQLSQFQTADHKHYKELLKDNCSLSDLALKVCQHLKIDPSQLKAKTI